MSKAAKFKRLRQLRHLAMAGALVAALAGCATPAPHSPGARKPAPQPLARAVVVTADADHDLMAQLLVGEMALNHTDLKTAATAYNKAALLSIDPRVAEHAVALSMATHDVAGMQRGLQRWQQLGGKPAELAQARAQLALARGDTGEARRQLELLITDNSQNAWRGFGRVLLSSQDSAQVANLLESLATPARLPADPDAWLAMSELGDRLGRHAYAQQVANAAMTRFKNAETYAWAAQLKYKNGDHAGAQALFRKALTREPGNVKLRLAYASMLAQQNDYVGAGKVLEAGSQNSDTYALRAAVAARDNDQAALTRIYRQLHSASTQQQADNAFLLGQLAETQNLRDEALNWYSQVDDQHEFDAAMRTALILQSQGKSADAHAQLEQIQVDYLDQPAQLRRAYELDAELYMQAQQFAEAIKAFSRALQIQPDEPALLYERGLAYAGAGQVDSAIKDFRRVLQLKPGDVDASNALGYTLADAGRDLAEAQQLIDRARAARPNDPAIGDSWGWLQYRLGHLDQAAQALNGAWQARKDADVGVHLGEVLWKLGRQQEARRLFDAIHRADPTNASLHDALQRLQP